MAAAVARLLAPALLSQYVRAAPAPVLEVAAPGLHSPHGFPRPVPAIPGRSSATDLQALQAELHALRAEVDQHRSDPGQSSDWPVKAAVMDKELDDLQEMLSELAKQEAHEAHRIVVVSHAELQSEIERLREAMRRVEGTRRVAVGMPEVPLEKDVMYDLEAKEPAKKQKGAEPDEKPPTEEEKEGGKKEGEKEEEKEKATAKGATQKAGVIVTPPAPGSAEGKEKGGKQKKSDEKSGGKAGASDVAGSMPFGDLEPFGREDTARALTEASIRESDAMVDQIERAEIAEEKRAVFRALTRLRGAAISSYDGVARSHTGNLDEFSRKFQWRSKHPIRHLASEENDVTRWAFPRQGSAK